VERWSSAGSTFGSASATYDMDHQLGEPMLCNYLNFKETPVWVFLIFPNQRIANFGSLKKNQNERIMNLRYFQKKAS
jgi:hypothetical protein